jgi:MFS family permease
MIAKPLTEDPTLAISEDVFTTLNLWAILLGSALCLPVGRLIDRFGARGVLVVVAAGLGLAVLGMSAASGVLVLFLTLLLVRGLGQGALSVVSMALVGKWFTRRLGTAMGLYTVLLGIGFMASFVAMGSAVHGLGWRGAWFSLGLILLAGMAPVGWLLARSTPEAIGLPAEGGKRFDFRPPDGSLPRAPLDLPLAAALRTPAFWTFTLAAALFNFAWSGITLLNENVLADQGLGNDTFQMVMPVLAVSGLPTNLVAGWLAGRWSMGKLLAGGMMVLAASLGALPWVTAPWHAVVYALGMGVAGGIVTVVFFAVYGRAFGRRELGAIQAVVQVISVFASALGPVALSKSKIWTSSYHPLFFAAAALSVVLAVACWMTPLPSRAAATIAE